MGDGTWGGGRRHGGKAHISSRKRSKQLSGFDSVWKRGVILYLIRAVSWAEGGGKRQGSITTRMGKLGRGQWTTPPKGTMDVRARLKHLRRSGIRKMGAGGGERGVRAADSRGKDGKGGIDRVGPEILNERTRGHRTVRP